jgi:WYL domain
MRYQMSVPIEFDFGKGGYYFTKPITDLPLFQLTEAELVSIFVAQKALEAYKGTAFEQQLRTAFQKLQAATGSANISVSWDDLDSAISFRQFAAAYLPDATIFSELAKAIQNKETVEFGYKKLEAKAFEKRMVEPWHLACVSSQWYLLSYDRNRGAPDFPARPNAEGFANGTQVCQFTARGGGNSTALPEQLPNLANRKRGARANRFAIFRPGRAARSRTELACESADPGVSRWEPRTHFNPEFFGGDHPLDSLLGEKL